MVYTTVGIAVSFVVIRACYFVGSSLCLLPWLAYRPAWASATICWWSAGATPLSVTPYVLVCIGNPSSGLFHTS